MTAKPILVTEEKAEQVVLLMRQFGYESKFEFLDKYIFDTIISNHKYIRVIYDMHRGFIVRTSSTWIEDVDAMAREATEAKMLYHQLERLLGGF
jgi:hypothetical protein